MDFLGLKQGVGNCFNGVFFGVPDKKVIAAAHYTSEVIIKGAFQGWEPITWYVISYSDLIWWPHPTPPLGVENVKIRVIFWQKSGEPTSDHPQHFVGPWKKIRGPTAPKRSKYSEICLKREWKFYIFRHFSTPRLPSLGARSPSLVNLI